VPVVLTVLLAAGIAAACDDYSIDPTDPVNFAAGTIVNDRASPVVVQVCVDDDCNQVADAGVRVAPGGQINEQVTWDQPPTPIGYAIMTIGGRRLGCLHLSAARHSDHPRVLVSLAGAC
jgi:hypothetical protein